MARPLSEEKREAILSAATALVATQGTGAPTAGIARTAGVAEGTLFTYFATKDVLLNALYLEIEAELADALLGSGLEAGSARDRARQVWDRFVDWGAANPAKRRALRQLKVSERITGESRRQGDLLFRDIRAFLERTFDGHVKAGAAPSYVGSVLEALAEMTIELVARDPARRGQHKEAGFDVFWKGIAG